MRVKSKKAKKSGSDETVVAFTSDWHVNSTIGLCPPRVKLDDGGAYIPSEEQEWLGEKWREFWQDVKELPGRKVAVVAGDVVESFHHGIVQLVTLNEAVELEMALEVAQVMVEAVDEVHVIRGTEAHTGGAGYKEELFAKRIGAIQHDPGRFSNWFLACAWSQVKFDMAHHPCTQSHREHTRDWAAGRQATETCLQYDDEGITRPDVIIRGHAHYLGNSYHRRTLCVFLPPWLLTTAFGYRKGAGHKIEPVGGVIFHCEAGRYSWEPWTRRLPRPKPW